MARNLTAKMLRAEYASLCKLAPFSRWRLPDADSVHFVTFIRPGVMGALKRSHAIAGLYSYCRDDRTHAIYLNGDKFAAGAFDNITTPRKVMAHEMVHLACKVANGNLGAGHGSQFKYKAAQVCRALGYDLATF